MTDDLVERLRKLIGKSHLYHHDDELLTEAATALTTARAEIERLKGGGPHELETPRAADIDKPLGALSPEAHPAISAVTPKRA